MSKPEIITRDDGGLELDVFPYTYGGDLRIPITRADAEHLKETLDKALSEDKSEWYTVTAFGQYGPASRASAESLCQRQAALGQLATVVHASEIRGA